MNNSEELENSLRLKLYEFLETPEIHSQTTEAFYIWQDNPDSIKVYGEEDEVDDELFARFLDWFIFDFKSFDNNLRIIELFRSKSEDNINTEERDVLNQWIQSTRSYFDIKDIRPGEYCALRDLFSHEELIVHDTIISNQLNITDIISARPLKTLDKNYFFSLVSVFPLILKPVITEFFDKNFQNYKNEHGNDLNTSDFLKDYGYLLGKNIDDVINHPHFLTPEGEDFVIASSIYKIKNKQEIITIFIQNKNFSPLNETNEDLVIFSLNKVKDKELDVYIEIEEKQLTVNANSVKTLDQVKIYLDQLLGNSIKHKKDSSKSFSDFSVGSSKPSFKLPKGVRSKKQFNSQLDQYYTNWIDTPLERLDGLSPRKALSTPEGREKLELILQELELLYEDAKKSR